MPARGWNRAAALAALSSPYPTFFGLPPEPWPDIPDDYVFGPEWQPPGTIYTFDEHSAAERFAKHGEPLALVISKLLGFGGFIDGTGTWVMPVRYARAQVVASLAGGEQLIHSLAFRPTDESSSVTGQVLHDFAAHVGDRFHAWMQDATVASNISSDLTYSEVRISYLEQTSGTAKDGTGGNLHTLVPTIVVPFNTPTPGGASANPLPYEVALCLTLQTDTRGPSTRGRLYLGGLAPSIMAAHGLFSAGVVSSIASAFGTAIIQDIHDNTSWRMNVVSKRLASGREVQGIAVGVVPDAQRRRRNQLAENFQQGWGTPPGAIPPS